MSTDLSPPRSDRDIVRPAVSFREPNIFPGWGPRL